MTVLQTNNIRFQRRTVRTSQMDKPIRILGRLIDLKKNVFGMASEVATQFPAFGNFIAGYYEGVALEQGDRLLSEA